MAKMLDSTGPFMKLTDPAVVEIMALAGFGHVVIDMEHGPIGYDRAQDLVRAGQLHGMKPFIRVSRNESSLILRALDIGAAGVHIPHVATKDAAKAAVEACYFHPKGDRGICKYVRAAGYTDTPAADHFDQANENVVPVLHIEGKEGVENLAEILEVDGIGVVFLGPYDLSQSCGVPGEVRRPEVIKLMEDACTMAKAKGVSVGTFADNTTDAQFWRDRGVSYMCLGVDVGILMDAAKKLTGRQ